MRRPRHMENGGELSVLVVDNKRETRRAWGATTPGCARVADTQTLWRCVRVVVKTSANALGEIHRENGRLRKEKTKRKGKMLTRRSSMLVLR